MAAAAKHLFSNLHHSSHGSKKEKSPSKQLGEDESTFQRRKEEEKHAIAQWECDTPLSPTQVAKDPSQKNVGNSSKHIKCEDFKLMKTLGTGTFARVWLAKLNKPQNGDEDKVFALKILKKVDVIKLKQVEHVRNERKILSAVAGHPFITTMVASFQDQDSLYMILDYCPGGEIFSYLRRQRRFPEATARFYAAEMALILEFLHEKEGVAYRDLKPENVLLDAEGHLKLVDFGFAKKLDGRTLPFDSFPPIRKARRLMRVKQPDQTWTLCGTPEYLAPETIKNSGHGCAVDWWAFGILIFEFLVGQPPFWDPNPMKIYEQITAGKLRYPTAMPEDAKDLITKLCQVDPHARLGNLRGRAADVKSHAWFKDIDWKKLYNREVEAPIKPCITSRTDTRNFENYDDEPVRKTVYSPDLAKKYDSSFASF